MAFLDCMAKGPSTPDGRRVADDVQALADGPAGPALLPFLADPRGMAFLEGVLCGSPFLGAAMRTAPDTLAATLTDGPDAAFEAVMTMFQSVPSAPSLRAAMKTLREARIRAALTVGLADLAGVWPTMQATQALSIAAAAAVDGALVWLMQDGAARGVFVHQDAADPTRGIIVLGMGKLGAYELNYSSDIDLMLFYDPEKMGFARPDRMQHEMTRLTRALVQMLDERTTDGYVARTDLRLRPDPASTPPAITVTAGTAYYESMGQNWERAAMIKARPVAGDIAAGHEFLAELRPFIWRRSLDFNAIRDIQSIKRQIDRREGGEPISAFSHNLKLGRGGIREIEFFAQTQQLIWGGRNSALRSSQTLQALQALSAAGHVAPAVAEEMSAAYLKLRDLEHRLQMVDDRQTHTTPKRADAEGFVRFAGFSSLEAFEEDVSAALTRVERHFAELFSDEPTLGGGGALSFTGADEHPDTLATISAMGFAAPEYITATIRSWHHGHIRATRTQRGRELLTELTPDILKRFGATPDPDRAFRAFQTFVEGLPAGVQIFALFQANLGLLDFVARVLGRSAYLADLIGRRPHVLDAALTDDFMQPPGDKPTLMRELAQALSDAADMQDALDSARRWLNDLRLSLGVQTMEGRLAVAQAAQTITFAADCVANVMLNSVRASFEEAHGAIPGGAFAVLAYGKWGSGEVTIGSDLDLVAVYDAPEGAVSDGEKPLQAAVYYMRLTQRLVTALTTATGEGRLFEVDQRLRPSGVDGPIATHIDALALYLISAAWTWELMALTRARAAAGDADLCARIEQLRRDALAAAAGRPDLFADAKAMRQRLASAKGAGGGPWDVRRRPGGMVDTEFVAQALALAHGDSVGVAEARQPGAQMRALVAAGVATPALGQAIAEAAEFWLAAQWMLRLIGHDIAAGAELEHPSTQTTLATALSAPDYTAATVRREALANAVSAAFADIFDKAASSDQT